MAVIITNMDMPKNCEECYFQHSPSYHMWVCPNGCPLRSADEMIAEINNLTAPKSDTEYQDGFYDCEQMILNIINKYCKENK